MEGAGFDRMCDPAYEGSEANGNHPSGALTDAPPTGGWFPAHFRTLLANAWPPA
jgi:cellulose 1,4-beta-cellobiosidase